MFLPFWQGALWYNPLMDGTDPKFSRGQLEKAITAQEGLRGILDDAILEITIAALRKQLESLEPESIVEQQRKQVTILFMDVVGSTSLFSEFDPEENMAIMDTALQELAAPVRTHGGKVINYMGDGFLAVFGLPKAQENDPEMAVRSGLAILETAIMIAQDLKKKYSIEAFQVRIGINTGLVVAGGVTEAEDTIVGATVNLAARLETAAPPGGLLISQHTFQHVRGIFDLYPGKLIQVKGFSEPVQVYQVQDARPHAFRFKNRGVEGIETPMVGREMEFKVLQAAVNAIEHDHTSRSITIVGEAGLGKSRLLDEFEVWLKQRHPSLILFQGRAAMDTSNLPYTLLRDLFVSHFKILDDDPLNLVKEKISTRFKEALAEDKNYERDAHFVGQLLDYDFSDSPYLQGVLENPQQLRDRALAYLIEFIKAHAAGGLVAVFLDDIHWADSSSMDLLEQMMLELSTQQILFVTLTRPSLFEWRTSWAAEISHQRLDLQPLSTSESERLLGQILRKVNEIPDQLSQLVLKYAEGNPFYLEELVRMLVEDGVIVMGESTWHIQSGRIPELQIPATLTGVVQARLDRLPLNERTVLQQASVVGRVFWDAALTYIHVTAQIGPFTRGSESLEIGQCLGILQEREMIFPHNESTFSDASEFMFKHALLQEVTYESVLKRTRRIYHAKAASWLINHSGDRVREFAGQIAGHLEKAGMDQEALDYLTLAAEKAASNFAMDEAVDFYARALALTPENDLEKRYLLLMGQENVLGMLGDRDSQRKLLETLTVIVDTLQDKHKKAALLIRKAWVGYWTSEISEGLSAARKAVTLSESIGDQSLSRQAYYACAWMLLAHGDPDLAQEQARVALTIARQAGDRRAEGNTLNILSQTFISQGDLYAALDYLNEFLAITRQIGDLEREVTALNNLGVVLTQLGDYPSAWDYFQQILTISQESGYRSFESTALVNLGWVASARGEWDLTRQYSEAGIALKREQEHSEAVAEALMWLGHAWLGLNQPQNAETAYRESLMIRQHLDQPQLALWVKSGLARAALEQGNLRDALGCVQEITSYLAAGGDFQETWEPLRIYLICSQILRSVGDPQADEILETAFNLLQDQAARIPDSTYRGFFLQQIPWHRAIIELI